MKVEARKCQNARTDPRHRAYEYDAIGNRKKSADSLTLPGTDNYTSNALNQYSSLTLNSQPPTLNPTYDADGNATAYPLPVAPTANSTLAWDAENRLISTTVNGTATNYLYDAQSRRIAKITGNVAELTIYDAWNPIADYTRSAGVPAVLSQSYTWGTDLSGTLQGAGGVGGLLSVTLNSQPSPLNYSPTYDGNGNVSEYLVSNGAVAAHFVYDAFGRVIVATGGASDFRIRFSTKKEDAETGLNYYGYRYYDPIKGMWPNRDPIEEDGGINLYGFLGNDALGRFDVLGMLSITIPIKFETPRIEMILFWFQWKFDGEWTIELNAGVAQEDCPEKWPNNLELIGDASTFKYGVDISAGLKGDHLKILVGAKYGFETSGDTWYERLLNFTTHQGAYQESEVEIQKWYPKVTVMGVTKHCVCAGYSAEVSSQVDGGAYLTRIGLAVAAVKLWPLVVAAGGALAPPVLAH